MGVSLAAPSMPAPEQTLLINVSTLPAPSADAFSPWTPGNFYQGPEVAGETGSPGHSRTQAPSASGTLPPTPGTRVPGCRTAYLLHLSHIPDKGFIIHKGEQFVQLVQV